MFSELVACNWRSSVSSMWVTVPDFNAFQQAHQPVALLMPILSDHDSADLPQRLHRPEALAPHLSLMM